MNKNTILKLQDILAQYNRPIAVISQENPSSAICVFCGKQATFRRNIRGELYWSCSCTTAQIIEKHNNRISAHPELLKKPIFANDISDGMENLDALEKRITLLKETLIKTKCQENPQTPYECHVKSIYDRKNKELAEAIATRIILYEQLKTAIDAEYTRIANFKKQLETIGSTINTENAP